MFNDCMSISPVPQDCGLPVFPVIMQALSSTHANYERPAQHHVLPNCGRERAPSSASLHPDLPLTRRRVSGGHLAQVALLQGGPPGPRGQPHQWSEEEDISFWPRSIGKTCTSWCDERDLSNFSFCVRLDPKLSEF